MRRLPALLLSLFLLAPPRPGLAQPAPEEAAYREVFSVAALGTPNPSLMASASFGLLYRGTVPNAASALARDPAGRSAWGRVGGAPTPAAAEATAMERCRRSLGGMQVECHLLASNAARPGGSAVPPAEGGIGPFRWAPMLLRRGPGAARGVLVWGHGYGGPVTLVYGGCLVSLVQAPEAAAPRGLRRKGCGGG